MNPDLLAQLAPEHAPPPLPWWPPAPGWWLLGLLVILAPLLLAWRWRNPLRRPRRAALRELAAARGLPAARLAAHIIENVLRRYALAVFPRAEVARLSGAAWLAFLAEHGAPALGGEPGRRLLEAAYGGPLEPEQQAWLAAAEQFVRVRRTRFARARLRLARMPRAALTPERVS